MMEEFTASSGLHVGTTSIGSRVAGQSLRVRTGRFDRLLVVSRLRGPGERLFGRLRRDLGNDVRVHASRSRGRRGDALR